MSEDEIVAARLVESFTPVTTPPLTVDKVVPVLLLGNSTRVNEDVDPRFTVGQRVRAKNTAPTTHTREPRYVRGREGVIDRDHGVFIFADTNAATGEQNPQHVYALRFEAAEPWQAQAFAMAVRLYEQGHFTWTEWAAELSNTIAAAGPSDTSEYYLHWLATLEVMVAKSGLSSKEELAG